ncbi:MAG: ribonuclease M5 [Acidaminococcaceae bacterium]|nr:ribonuclease M5 [Acidaminococcaceae bacterium]HAY61125.1 ribonuclease M5 [Acidaminococcaceae bacterium]
MLKEVLIVEGKMDTVAVRRALDCETIETGGFALRPGTLRQIEAAYHKRGIIILTDPDGSGERIRKFLTKKFPNAGQAFVPKKDASVPDDVGIEQAKPEAIREALRKVRHESFTPAETFTAADLRDNGLAGSPDASARRALLGAELGIGYGTGKTFLRRLNTYGVTREEFTAALRKLDGAAPAEE